MSVEPVLIWPNNTNIRIGTKVIFEEILAFTTINYTVCTKMVIAHTKL